MAGGMPNLNSAAPAVPQDYIKLFKQEKENLEFDEGFYKWVGEDVEDRVLRKYGKLPPLDSWGGGMYVVHINSQNYRYLVFDEMSEM